MSKRLAYNPESPVAQRLRERRSSELIQGLSTETRRALRLAIVRGLNEGLTPHDLAGVIQRMIGLTTAQAQAVLSYRQQMVDLGHTLDRVNELVGVYADKKLQQRAMTIARTESMRAVNEGVHEAWRQAQRSGKIGPKARKKWVADADACDHCAPLHGTTVPVDGAFVYRGTRLSGPPAHPNCRCTLMLVTS